MGGRHSNYSPRSLHPRPDPRNRAIPTGGLDRLHTALLHLAHQLGALYTVHMIQRSATEARRLFFQLLDAAQRGEDVRVTRDGVQFRLTVAEGDVGREAEHRSPFAAIDPAVLSGEWRWSTDDSGQLQFEVDPRAAAEP